tara:strand:+ start:2853 stop:3605 length:753 start_codon:yes stop_codon:yes gene_type:complete
MLISNFPLSILAYIFLVYVLCGVIKGSIGFGMPTVSISLLFFIIDIKIIIALILIPTLIVNIYQLSRGGNFIKIINETKFFLIFSTIFIYPGAYLLKKLDSFYIIFFIALILISNSALYLFKINIKLPYHDKYITQIIVGSLNGVVTGMTSIYTMPLVFLLQSLEYNKNTTIQFLGIAFFLYPLGQLISFVNFDLFSKEIIINSVIILIPIFVGLIIGQKIRQKISEALFQKFFYTMLLFMSAIILFNLI